MVLVHATNVFAPLVLAALIHRLRLTSRVMDGSPLFDPAALEGAPIYLMTHLLADVLVAGALVMVMLPGFMVVPRVAPPSSRRSRAAWLAMHALALGLISAVSLITLAHFALLMLLNSGLSVDLIREAVQAGFTGATGYLTAVELGDVVPGVLPPLLYLALIFGPDAFSRLCRWAAAAVVAMAVMLNLISPPPVEPLAPEVSSGPLMLLAGELLEELQPAGAVPLPPVAEPPPQMYAQLRRPASTGPGQRAVRDVEPAAPEERQLRSVQLVPPLLASSGVPARKLPPPSSHPWNVVLVVMESTGAGYVFDPGGGKVPMPFLHRLARRGLVLANHYSTSNTSPHSLFSLLSGLYPMPRGDLIHSVQKGLRFPSLFTRLPGGHASLLVSPGVLTWYFPRDYMDHRGPKEIHGFKDLPVRRSPPGVKLARYDTDAVTFFLRRLDRLRSKPFVAVYYSFAAHWPYPDLGPRYRRFPAPLKRHRGMTKQQRLNRYRNNLYMLDTQIRRIHDHLQKRKLLQRTIMVLVGDHGEAFGQHRNNWIHSRHSYDENLRVPAIFYQPGLFPTRRETRTTSHVDVLPTLLDAMGMTYNRRLVQGESVFQDRFARNYIFLFGKENTLSSISRRKVKLQLSLKTGKCWAYDLAKDPREQRRLSCKGHAVQHRALLFYRRYQRAVLKDYNRACSKGLAFHGQQHPPAR